MLLEYQRGDLGGRRRTRRPAACAAWTASRQDDGGCHLLDDPPRLDHFSTRDRGQTRRTGRGCNRRKCQATRRAPTRTEPFPMIGLTTFQGGPGRAGGRRVKDVGQEAVQHGCRTIGSYFLTFRMCTAKVRLRASREGDARHDVKPIQIPGIRLGEVRHGAEPLARTDAMMTIRPG